MNRRFFLGAGLAAAAVAPAIIRTPGLLMPIRPAKPCRFARGGTISTCHLPDGSIEIVSRSFDGDGLLMWQGVAHVRPDSAGLVKVAYGAETFVVRAKDFGPNTVPWEHSHSGFDNPASVAQFKHFLALTHTLPALPA